MVIRELAQIRKEHKRELEYEKFDGYELPPRTQFSMLNKPAVSIKYGVMKFNMACIRLFEGMLLDTYEDKVNKVVLKDAFAATCNKRGTDHLQEQAEEIIKIIEADTVM